MDRKPATIFFHLHLVSDATGETLNAIAKAGCAHPRMSSRSSMSTRLCAVNGNLIAC